MTPYLPPKAVQAGARRLNGDNWDSLGDMQQDFECYEAGVVLEGALAEISVLGLSEEELYGAVMRLQRHSHNPGERRAADKLSRALAALREDQL